MISSRFLAPELSAQFMTAPLWSKDQSRSGKALGAGGRKRCIHWETKSHLELVARRATAPSLSHLDFLFVEVEDESF